VFKFIAIILSGQCGVFTRNRCRLVVPLAKCETALRALKGVAP
jgi:hypothetical protein